MKIIGVSGGSVLRVLKNDSNGFYGFGEAYFSIVECGVIRGWKCHKSMTLNLVVPEGAIRFVVYDERVESSTFDSFEDVTLSRECYSRLTIPPGVLVGFQGVGKNTNLLLNIADIHHDDNEVDNTPLDSIKYDW